MHITTKGQVTIPKYIRESLGITPESEIGFQEENGRFYIVKTGQAEPGNPFKKFRGIATAKMTTDQIMNLTRHVE